MKRLTTIITFIMLLGTLMVPKAASAQVSSPCDAYEPLDVASGATLKGGGGNQVLIGSNGPDVLRGGGGHDILCGFGGNDSLIGGSGNDWLGGGAGDDVLRGNSGNDTLANGETNRPGSGNDEIVTIVTPFLTADFTVSPSGETFSGAIIGAGLQPGEPVLNYKVYGPTSLTIPVGYVQSDGTVHIGVGASGCNIYDTLQYSTTDQFGNTISTDGVPPC